MTHDINQNTSRIIVDESQPNKSKVGYVRVSTVDQNEADQLKVLEQFNLYKTFIEVVSTRDPNRPILHQMLEYVRSGDTIYVTSLARLARSTKDLLNIAEVLNEKEVKIISIKESIDTETPTGRLMLSLISTIYEFDRENVLERQREGIAIAKSQGKFKGRKEIDRPGEWDEVYNLYKSRNITGTEAMERLGLKRNTFYKFVKREKFEG